MISSQTTNQNVTVRVNGRYTAASSVVIDGRVVLGVGKFLKRCSLMDEDMMEGEPVRQPERFIEELKSSNVRGDIFNFAQKIPDSTPRYSYHLEWDSAAVVPITTYQEWFKDRAKYDVRKAVKRAARLGVVTKLVDFDDKLVEGICGIYNESPIRQGRPFLHYQKSFETIKEEAGTYVDRSAFVGAYFNDELIGFIKMVYVGPVATTLHVISKKAHYDKKPMNALIAKAVEVCEQSGMKYLMYGNFFYREKGDSLTEFKRRNGFEEMRIPRYYVPLTNKGALALKLGLHRGVKECIPERWLDEVRNLRNKWYSRRERGSEAA